MRYAYAITTALLLGGAATTMVLQPAASSAQTAQNEPGTIAAAAPKAGAPMSFADMVAKLQPAVVNISTKQKVQVQAQVNPFNQLFGIPDQGGGAPVTREGQSLGSGFLISPDGYIVTNAHVITAGARGAKVESITVTLFNRKEYVAKVIGSDTLSDLAVLKVDATNLPFVKFGDSSKARVGDWVIAIGEPFGLGGTVTAGIVSALNRVTGQGGAYDRFIQTDAAINKGNSGGPMFDLNGNVIGINSQIFSPSEGSVGIGFAIPAESAKPIIETMIKGGKIERGYLGVTRQAIDEDIAASLGIAKDKGEIIGRVEPNSPAAKGGMKDGDIVLTVDGKDVDPQQSLTYLIANKQPGTVTKIGVMRNGKPMTLNITVGVRPGEEELAGIAGGSDNDDGPDQGDDDTGQHAATDQLGIQVSRITPAIASQLGLTGSITGVIVMGVDPSSDAGQKLKRGDVISSVNRAPVTTPAEVDAAVKAAKAQGRTSVLLFITRPGQGSIYVPVTLKGS